MGENTERDDDRRFDRYDLIVELEKKLAELKELVVQRPAKADA